MGLEYPGPVVASVEVGFPEPVVVAVGQLDQQGLMTRDTVPERTEGVYASGIP